MCIIVKCRNVTSSQYMQQSNVIKNLTINIISLTKDLRIDTIYYSLRVRLMREDFKSESAFPVVDTVASDRVLVHPEDVNMSPIVVHKAFSICNPLNIAINNFPPNSSGHFHWMYLHCANMGQSAAGVWLGFKRFVMFFYRIHSMFYHSR